MFISGLLDLTDNLVDGAVVPPPDVVRHDDDDPYLVVAADKGTAQFSDIANEVAAAYGFWLGDAFASGGSVGYDHKAMGITARRVGERQTALPELGVDVQADVHRRRDRRHVRRRVRQRHAALQAHPADRGVRPPALFVDPDPTRRAFAERGPAVRAAPVVWDDYDPAPISEGGGVWPRTAKSVPITPQVRAALGIGEDVTELSPHELIRRSCGRRSTCCGTAASAPT